MRLKGLPHPEVGQVGEASKVPVFSAGFARGLAVNREKSGMVAGFIFSVFSWVFFFFLLERETVIKKIERG